MIIKFNPLFFHKIWGGQTLKHYYHVDLPNVGEVWGISAHNMGSNTVSNGYFKGITLQELFHSHAELFGYYDGREFPILVKLIDAKEDLSIQVHPDNEYALTHEDSLGKDEEKMIGTLTSILVDHKLV